MKAVAIALATLMAAGCLSYHSVQTERVNAEQERRIAELEKELASLREEHEQLKATCDWVALLEQARKATPTPVQEVPVLDAKVTAVDEERNIIDLSIGSQDGVRAGFEFTVYRGDIYVGKVVVDDVLKKRCTGFSKKELQAKPIQIGDRARTRW